MEGVIFKEFIRFEFIVHVFVDEKIYFLHDFSLYGCFFIITLINAINS